LDRMAAEGLTHQLLFGLADMHSFQGTSDDLGGSAISNAFTFPERNPSIVGAGKDNIGLFRGLPNWYGWPFSETEKSSLKVRA
ncbi:MAG TPA: hypothetical protein VLR92_04600, partial [Blastocatellia bacterium]|nr:hypothetical protein [Blastocatellia bacterium]